MPSWPDSLRRICNRLCPAFSVTAATLVLMAFSGSVLAADPPTLIVQKCNDFEVTGTGDAIAWEACDWVELNRRDNGQLDYTAQFKMLYSDTGVYVLFDGSDQTLTATMQADFLDLWNEDVFECFFWTNPKDPVYFEYEISPLGFELPILVPNFDGQFLGWRPWHYEGARKIQKKVSATGGENSSMANVSGWRAEIFIPYAVLEPLRNVPPQVGTQWRANFYRVDYDAAESTGWDWARVGASFHDTENFGTLIFGKQVESQKPLEELRDRKRADWQPKQKSNVGRPSMPTPLTEGGIVMTFDDRNFNDWIEALPLFDEFGVKATFFISGEIDGPARRAIEQLIDHGHAIGSHSVNHLKADEYFEASSPEVFMQREIDPQMKEFKAAGIAPASFAYPMSRNNAATNAALLKVFRHLRTGRKIAADKRLSEDDAFFIPASEIAEHGCLYGKGIDHTPTQPDRTYEQLDGALERVAENREIIVLYAHQIRETGTGNFITPKALKRVFSKANELGLQFYTFDELP